MRVFEVQSKLHGLVVGFFRSLAQYAIRHPRRVLAAALAITLAAASGIGWLKLRTDGHALVTQTAPEAVYDQAIREQFGIEDDIVVLIHSGSADGIFNPGTMQLVRDLTAAFTNMPGIHPGNVMSLATEPSFRFRPGTLVNQTLLEPPLKTKAELDLLRDDLRRIELYTSTLVSSTGQSTVILIGTPPGSDRAALYQKVLSIVAARRPLAEEVGVTGAPVAESLLGIHILEDLGVPKAFLGTSTRGEAQPESWKRPGSFYEWRLLIARRVGLVPVAAAVMMLVFLVSFRNGLASLLPLPGLAATLLFVFGLMGWCGVPVYLTIAVMPVLLAATGITNDVYVFNRYFTLLQEHGGRNHVELVSETFDKMASPVASTSLTTGIGFLSFGLSPLGPVKVFGLCTGIGVLFGLIYSFTVVPAMLTLINPRWLRSGRRVKQHAGPSALAAWFGRLGPAVARWRLGAGAALLVTALTPLGLLRLMVQDSWTDGFDPDSEFRRVTQQVNEEFYGMHLLLVCCDAPQLLTGTLAGSAVTAGRIVLPGGLVADPNSLPGSHLSIVPADDVSATSGTNAAVRRGWHTHIETAAGQGNTLIARTPRERSDIAGWQSLAGIPRLRFEIAGRSQLKPEIIRALDELGSFIRTRRQYAVGGVLSPADYLRTTRFMVRANDPGARVLPGDMAEAKLMWDYYRIARGPQRLRQVVDTNYSRSLTSVFLKNANFADTAKLMSDIRGYEREHLTPKGIKVGFAGDVALSQSLIHGIVSTQLHSLLWSLAGIYLVTAVLGGSWRWGVFCVLPSALAVLVKLALMGWFGIPLGVATSMFAAMTLGIGVNCSIQLLESYAQARADGASLPEGLSRAMALTGPPALINTIAVSLGFSVLMFSQVPANARLGFLLVLGLVECFVASLLLLPVLLRLWPQQPGPSCGTAPANHSALKAPEAV